MKHQIRSDIHIYAVTCLFTLFLFIVVTIWSKFFPGKIPLPVHFTALMQPSNTSLIRATLQDLILFQQSDLSPCFYMVPPARIELAAHGLGIC